MRKLIKLDEEKLIGKTANLLYAGECIARGSVLQIVTRWVRAHISLKAGLGEPYSRDGKNQTGFFFIFLISVPE